MKTLIYWRKKNEKRNKKTGKVQTCDFMVISDDRSRDGEIARLNSHVFIFRSIEQLNEEYEDYKPTEPIIKDEKIRKAVRAWAEACGLSYATYKQASNEFYDPNTRGAFAIKFKLIPVEVYLEDGECYTIAELCGEDADEA